MGLSGTEFRQELPGPNHSSQRSIPSPWEWSGVVGEAEGAGEQEARRMQGKAGAPPPLCTPAQRPTQLPTCYLLYKYFLNYQRILVSTFCAWLVSRSKGDRDRMESRTEKETKKGETGRWRGGERE